MSVNTAAAAYGAGRFGTAHRAPVEFAVIRQHRARGLGIQTIANITGYSMEDVSRALAAPEEKPAANDAADWPLGDCGEVPRAVIQHLSRKRGVSLCQIAALHTGRDVSAVRNEMFAAVREFCPELSFVEIGRIFLRDPAQVQHGMEAHLARVGIGS